MEELSTELEASPGPLPGALTLGGALTACGTPTASTPEETSAPAAEVQALAATSQALTAPKYVFLFIGDGMSYPQIQSTSDYLAPWPTRTTGRPSPAWTTTAAPSWTAPST